MNVPTRWTVLGIGGVLLASGCATTPHTAAPQDIEAGVYLRIVNYNVAKLNSENCTAGALTAVFQALNEDDKSGFALAPHVYVFQEVRSTDVDLLLSCAANVKSCCPLARATALAGVSPSGLRSRCYSAK